MYLYEQPRLWSYSPGKSGGLYPTTEGISWAAVDSPPRHNGSIVPRLPPGPKARRIPSSLGALDLWTGANLRGTTLRSASAETRTPLNSEPGSGVGTESSTAAPSSSRLQLFSPATGVKSCTLLQLLLKTLRPASLKWKASSG
ncbi:hypothetical protein EYF80_035984 [Liparis tanakae]|uniref:Uncharacterized protein n=1 Tax=Liparis tanakae TaxID=230148 RepID=A0A4Z2GKL0_9TELE|nr:hypothetical protein EYF80_035984 [Liparis tanakae]